MCISPVEIDNPNYHLYHLLEKRPYLNVYTQKIPVPCGRCNVCLSLKQQYLVQRVQMESLSHDLYFGTLTYRNEFLPCLDVSGMTVNYFSIADWQSMIKYIRKYENLPDFKYMLVTEYGGRRHRPHAHFMLSFESDQSHTLADRQSFAMKLHDIFLKHWRRNIAYTGKKTKTGKKRVNTRNPVWMPLCDYVRTRRGYNFDLHYLNPNSTFEGVSSVAFYVSKYCLKYDKWIDRFKSKLFFSLDHDTFTFVWDLVKPRILLSKGFGSVHDPKVFNHLWKGIELAENTPDAIYPYFISPVDGSTYPLSPYYQSKLLRISDLNIFDSRKDQMDINDIDVDSIDKNICKFMVRSDHLYNQHTFFDDEANDVNDFSFSDRELKRIPRLSDFDDFPIGDGF